MIKYNNIVLYSSTIYTNLVTKLQLKLRNVHSKLHNCLDKMNNNKILRYHYTNMK